MLKRTLLVLCLLLTFAPEARAQLGSVPNVFSAGTTISSSAMNTNFSTIYSNALNRTGGTMTGSLTTLDLLPTTDNASDIGSAALSYNEAWFDGAVTVGSLVSTGALTATSLDTGFGANELYGMDQHVLTTSSPTFADITTGSINRLTTLTANRILYGSASNTEGTSANFTFDGTAFNVGSATDYLQYDGNLYFYEGEQGFVAYSAALEQQSASATADDGAYHSFLRYRGTLASPSIVQSGDFVGGFYFDASHGVGSEMRGVAAIVSEVDGTPGTNDMPGRLRFFTTLDGAGTVTEHMRLNSAGNLGLGASTTISAKLHVIKTTEQLRVGYDASNYQSTTVGSTGTTIYDLVGTSPFFQFNDLAVLTTNSGVFGAEGGTASFVINADESDDAGDRWTFAASDGSTSGELTLTHAGSTFGGNFTIINVDDVRFTAGEGTDLDLILQTDDGDDANDQWKITVDVSDQFSITNAGGGSFGIAATGAVTIPYLASSSGTRYVCSDTNGTLTDSASACSGTDPDALAVELAELRGQVATLLGQRQSWAALPAVQSKAPVYIASNATSVPAGQGLGLWFQLAEVGTSCDQLNPVANDFVAFYACMESSYGRNTQTGSGGLFGSNVVLTAYSGRNITMVGHEVDIQNVSGEGVNVPAAMATNGKVGYAAVLASNGTTTGDGSAGVSVTTNGDAGDQWRYGYEASGVRTASFYARKVGNAGTVNPNTVLLGDVDSANFLRTTGAHTRVLDSQYVDIFGTQDGRIDIAGLNPVMNMYESDQPLNGKFWRYQVAGGDFTIETVNDAYTSAARVLALTRAGAVNIPSLAGNGERQVCVQSDGTLSVCVGSQR